MPDSYTTTRNTTLVVAAPGVLANDTDPNGDALTAVLVTNPAHGTLTLNADGSFTYTPTGGYTGPDSFIYRARDASNNLSADTNVALTVTLPGTPVADRRRLLDERGHDADGRARPACSPTTPIRPPSR